VLPEDEVNRLRLSLLAAMVNEAQDPIAQLDGSAMPSRASQQLPAGICVKDGIPSVAVIIPLFNGSRYIEQTIASVFRQTLLPSEVVVINDGSTDGCDEVVKRLAKTHPISLLNTENHGQSAARNVGVRESRSDLIAFLDQDDIWYQTHLESLVQPFLDPSDPPVGWVYSNVDEIDQDDHLVSRSFLNLMPAVHPKKQMTDCLRENIFVLPSASLVTREAFEAVGGFDERLCGYEDDDLFFRIFRRGYDNVYINRALSQWRIYSKSASYTPRFAQSRLIYCQKLLDLFPDNRQLNHYYTRDLIVPRFLSGALYDYETTLLSGDGEDSAWAQVVLLARHCDNVPPAITEHALNRYDRTLRLGDQSRIEVARQELLCLSAGNDLAVRRMVELGLRHYKSVLSNGDNDGVITAVWNEIFQLTAGAPNVYARLFRTLSILRKPSLARVAFSLRHVLRPAMLWAFSTRPPTVPGHTSSP
jgi:glycosyltransferase involved in cell wall biosynthesis